GDPSAAFGDDENRCAAHAGMVFLQESIRHSSAGFSGGCRPAALAVWPDCATARSGHGASGVCCRLLRDLLCRVVILAADSRGVSDWRWPGGAFVLSGPDLRARCRLDLVARLSEIPCLHLAGPEL